MLVRLAALCPARGPEASRFASEAREWVETNTDAAEWPAVWYLLFGIWKRLVTRPEDRHRLFRLAIQWIEEHPNSPDALFIAGHAMPHAANIGDEESVKHMVKSLIATIEVTARGNAPGWLQTWFASQKHINGGSEPDPTLRARLDHAGIEWLAAPDRVNQEQFLRIAPHALRTGYRRQEMRALAQQYVVQGWPRSITLATQLIHEFSDAPPDRDLVAWICKWLHDNAGETRGLSVWERLTSASDRAIGSGQGGTWLELQRALRESRPLAREHWHRLLRAWEEGGTVHGKVVGVAKKGSRWSGHLGFMVDVGIQAYIALPNFMPGATRIPPSVGKEYDFKILRLDSDRFQIDLTRLPILKAEREERFSRLTPGTMVRGIVTSHQPYGIFVETQSGAALLHLSNAALAEGDQLHARYPIGSDAEFAILETDVETGRISLSATAPRR